MEKLIIISGTTGGTGQEIVKRCYHKGIEDFNTIALYRDEKKFIKFFGNFDDLKENSIIPFKWEFSGNFNGIDKLTRLLQLCCPSIITFIHTAYEIKPIEKIGNIGYENICKNISCNVTGIVMFIDFLINYATKHNIKLNIFNMDSGAAYHPLKGWGLYSAGKAYINMFFRTIQLESSGINVVTYEPGVIDTPMQKTIRETNTSVFEQAGEFISYYVNGKLNSPSDIAEDIFNRFIKKWDVCNFSTSIKG